MPPTTPTPTTPKNNTSKLVIEIVAGLLVLVVGYFGYTMFSDSSASTLAVSNVQLGKNLSSFAKESKGISLDFSILETAYVKSLEDHTQIFTYSTRRGRLDPFLPYDSTRPIR